MRRFSAFFTLALATGFSFAAESTREIDFGVDINAEREHQVFDDSSADLDTVSLQPYVMVDNWSFSLDVPWQRASGEKFVNNNYAPRVEAVLDAFCPVYLAATPLQQTLWKRNHPAYADTVDSACAGGTQATEDVSGLGDITAFAHYGLPLDNQGVWLASFGVGYKADNGNLDDGLSSGTQDVKVETSLGAGFGKFSSTLLIGYDWVVGGDYQEFAQDYGYAALDMSVRASRWLVLGATWNYEQSYVEELDDITSLSAYLTLKPTDSLRFRVFYKDYLDVAAYPDHSLGGAVSYAF